MPVHDPSAARLSASPRAELTTGRNQDGLRAARQQLKDRRRADPAMGVSREPTRGLEPRTPSLRVLRFAVFLAPRSQVRAAQVRSGALGIGEFGTRSRSRLSPILAEVASSDRLVGAQGLRPHRQPQWRARPPWVDVTKGVLDIAQVIAILGAAAWAYFKFVRGRTFTERLEPSVYVTPFRRGASAACGSGPG